MGRKRREVFTFAQLTKRARAHAIDEMRDINVEHDQWWESTYEFATSIGEMFGVAIEHIYFSGFWSQGDGACFTGHYNFVKGSKRRVRKDLPNGDEKLFRIVDDLFLLQRRSGYLLYAKVTHHGSYSHEGSTEIEVCCDEPPETEQAGLFEPGVYEPPDEDCKELRDLLRSFMRWIYELLEKEYEYLTSDELVQETIEANEYTFDEDGNKD